MNNFQIKTKVYNILEYLTEEEGMSVTHESMVLRDARVRSRIPCTMGATRTQEALVTIKPVEDSETFMWNKLQAFAPIVPIRWLLEGLSMLRSRLGPYDGTLVTAVRLQVLQWFRIHSCTAEE